MISDPLPRRDFARPALRLAFALAWTLAAALVLAVIITVAHAASDSSADSPANATPASRIVLANGRVWEQAEVSAQFVPRVGETIALRQGATGSFLMRAEHGSAVHTRRLR